jgi:histidine triad (HIT) family protein
MSYRVEFVAKICYILAMSRAERAHESSMVTETPSQDIFCQIIERKLPSIRVFETDIALVIMDKFGGYPLVLSKDHSDKNIPQMLELAGKMIPHVRKAYQADGIRIQLNYGAAAGQEIPHPHVHIMPRKRVDSGVGRTFGAEDDLEKQRMAKRLKELSKDLIPHLDRKKS